MRLAIEEAKKSQHSGEVPVGALLLAHDGKILARAHNRCIAGCDPTAHAEIMAMRLAGAAAANYRLGGSYLVVTLEPCMMCAGALVHARIEGVVYGARDKKAGAIESCMDGLEQYFHNHRPWHLGGILEDECAALLSGFFEEQRR